MKSNPSTIGVPTLLFLFVIAMAGSLTLRAQSTTADILGTVTDSSGAAVLGATVKITSQATAEVRTLTTDDHGNYVSNSLLPGHYRVNVTAQGFKTFEVPDLLAAAGDRARVDAQLTTGSATDTVTVTGSTPLLQTDSSTVATTVVEKSVQDLPLNGRNFVQLAQLTVGADEGPQGGLTSGSGPDDRRQTSSISVNGQSDIINNYMIDGADDNERIIGSIGIRPSIDAISEFRAEAFNVFNHTQWSGVDSSACSTSTFSSPPPRPTIPAFCNWRENLSSSFNRGPLFSRLMQI